jgi:predicted nucleic acid-binding Zn ribbon protein
MPNGYHGSESPEDLARERARRRRFWLVVVLPLAVLLAALVVYVRTAN